MHFKLTSAAFAMVVLAQFVASSPTIPDSLINCMSLFILKRSHVLNNKDTGKRNLEDAGTDLLLMRSILTKGERSDDQQG